MTSEIKFTSTTFTAYGEIYPASYSITPTGKVVMFMGEDGMPTTFVPGDEHYTAALQAAQDARRESAAQRANRRAHAVQTVEPVPTTEPELTIEQIDAAWATEREAQAAKWAEQKAQREARKAENAIKYAKTSAPVDKPWVGTSIKGKGWEIYFDPGYEKTRVIFKSKPTVPVIEAVKAAGFCWSPQLKSWNKKLTNKAFRAAQDLANTLHHMTCTFRSA